LDRVFIGSVAQIRASRTCSAGGRVAKGAQGIAERQTGDGGPGSGLVKEQAELKAGPDIFIAAGL